MSPLAAPLASPLGGDPGSRTLADITTIVRFRGDFRNVQRFPTANVQSEIQAAWAELYELIADTQEGYWDTDLLVLTTVGTTFSALPNDTWRVRGVDRLDGTSYLQLRQVGIEDRNRFSTDTGEPVAYRLTSRGLDLYPTPNAVYTIRVTYTPIAPTLDEEIPFTYYNAWEEFVIYGALLRLALNEERDVSSWQQQLDYQRQRITRGASQRKAQEPEYIPIGGGYDEIDRDGWWR